MDETTPTSRDSAPATPASALPSFDTGNARNSAGADLDRKLMHRRYVEVELPCLLWMNALMFDEYNFLERLSLG